MENEKLEEQLKFVKKEIQERIELRTKMEKESRDRAEQMTEFLKVMEKLDKNDAFVIANFIYWNTHKE